MYTSCFHHPVIPNKRDLVSQHVSEVYVLLFCSVLQNYSFLSMFSHPQICRQRYSVETVNV